MKPSEVLSATKVALQERRLFRCLNCCSVNMKPLNSEWLRPHGLLYNIAKKQSSGILQDNRIYSFQSYVSWILFGWLASNNLCIS